MTEFAEAILAELADDIRDHRVACFVGTGVTIGAVYKTHQHMATWRGLLEAGVERCVSDPRARWRWGRDKRVWERSSRDALASSEMTAFLSVATDITAMLRSPADPFASWLAESIGGLRVRDSTVLERLDDLDTMLLTTNYDDLLTTGTGRVPATWADRALVQKILQDEKRGVIHVHGCWSRPDTVVLGRNQYDTVVKDAFAQGALRALRTMKKILFIGFGQGIEDPNFTQFFEWSQRLFQGCGRSCYKLVLASEADAQETHGAVGNDQIRLVAYGKRHEDLPDFLADLKRAAFPPKPALDLAVAAPLPNRPQIVGREPEISAITAAITTVPHVPVLLRGPVAVGKTSILVNVLHEERTRLEFGQRRYFVRCDGARSYDLLLTEIARIIGATRSVTSVEKHVLAHFDADPAVLMLDRFEVPWRADSDGCERLINLLCNKARLSLAIAMDGDEAIPSLAHARSFAITRLSLDDARALFLQIAGTGYLKDRYLNRLLEALDHMPLAIEVMAHLARGEPDLKRLWERWTTESASIFGNGSEPGHLARFSVSLKTALDYTQFSTQAVHLLAALSLLPAGIAYEHVDAIVDSAARAAAELRQRGLVVDQHERLRVLAPIREFIRNALPPDPRVHTRLVEYFVSLAEDNGRLVRREGESGGIARLVREVANFEALFDTYGTPSSDSQLAVVALELSDFVQHTGLGSTRLLRRAIRVSETSASLKARCHVRLGDLLLSIHDDVEQSAKHFDDALRIYQELGARREIGGCIIRRGDVQLARGNAHLAECLYTQALKIAKAENDPFDEADCIVRLGDLALRRREYRSARRLYGQAARVFANLKNEEGSTAFALRVRARRVLGGAMCLQRLAVVAERSRQLRRAHDLLGGAYRLCERSGFAASQADTALALGDVSLELNNAGEAKQWYDDAKSLYARCNVSSGIAEAERRSAAMIFRAGNLTIARIQCEHALQGFRESGDLTGEGGCLADLGAIALAQGDDVAARAFWTEALRLFAAVGDHYWLAVTHEHLSEVSSSAERELHEFRARNAWAQYMDDREAIPKRERVGMWASFVERRRNPWVAPVLSATVAHNRRRTSKNLTGIAQQLH